jgi:hypothetical protein
MNAFPLVLEGDTRLMNYLQGVSTKDVPHSIENLQTHFRKSKFPYISYTFTGKLGLTDVHPPDVYLVDVHLTYTGVHLAHKRVPDGPCISQACTSWACISQACIS